MTTRAITGILYHADGVTVWAGAAVIITPAFAGSYESAGVTDASGVFTIVVPLPDSGNGTYVARFPGDVALTFIMGQGTTVYDISTIIAGVTSVAPAAQSQTLTDAATIAWNTALGSFALMTLGGSRILGTPTNLSAGKTYQLLITQDATGSRLVTWPANVKWAGGTAPTLSTAAAKKDLVVFECDGTNLYGRATLDVR